MDVKEAVDIGVVGGDIIKDVVEVVVDDLGEVIGEDDIEEGPEDGSLRNSSFQVQRI